MISNVHMRQTKGIGHRAEGRVGQGGELSPMLSSLCAACSEGIA